MTRKNHLFLIYQLAITDFKLRYSSSVLGYLWSLLNPLLMFGVLYFVFSIYARWDMPYYVLYLLLGIMLWTFFGNATSNAINALLYKRDLITKINFPKRAIIISSIITSLITLALSLVVFLIFFIIAGATLKETAILFPVYILELVILASGAAFLLSAFNLKYRDIQHLWSVLLQLGFWMTPIVYPLSFVPARYAPLVYLNPIARIIIDSREALIYHSVPTLRHHFFSLTFVCALFVVGYFVFIKMEGRFAEYV